MATGVTEKIDLKRQARQLRLKGYSYKEITQELAIAKSTLSYWLRNIELTPEQRLRLIKKGSANQHIGSEASKRLRLERTSRIIYEAKSEVQLDLSRDLWLIGVILYWAEGAKQKIHNPSQGVVFSNSDPKIIKLFLKWVKEYLLISENNLTLEVYIHKSYKKSRESLINYWSSLTGVSKERFTKIRYKRNKIRSYRKNRGDNYYGVLRVRVKKSTDLNRKITGWVEGICTQFNMV